MGRYYDLETFGKDEYITKMNNKNCIDCNACCGMFTQLTQHELDFLYKKVYNDKHLRDYIINKIKDINSRYMMANQIYMICPFSDNIKRCVIYDIRPSICMKFHCDDTSTYKANNESTGIVMFSLFERFLDNIYIKGINKDLLKDIYLNLMRVYAVNKNNY